MITQLRICFLSVLALALSGEARQLFHVKVATQNVAQRSKLATLVHIDLVEKDASYAMVTEVELRKILEQVDLDVSVLKSIDTETFTQWGETPPEPMAAQAQPSQPSSAQSA